MRKSGFTLVELIAVIVILMVIVLLATSGYQMVMKRVKQTTYENKVSDIETKAVEYANKTGKLSLIVDQLVKEGILVADDEDGNVINPIDESSMNCKIVYITKDTGNLYGNYTEQEVEGCDASKLEIESMYIKINAYAMNENDEKQGEELGDKWVRSNVYLEAEFTDLSIDKNEVQSIKWKSNAEEKESNEFFYKVKAEQIINSMYFVEIKMNDGTIYQAEKMVKIDKQRPVIYDQGINIEKKEEWTTNKEITIQASDGNGSGIYGYYIGTNNDCINLALSEYERNPEKEEQDNIWKKTILENGTYYVCIRDNAGNLSEDVSTKSFTINNIDKEPPVVVVKQNPLTIGNGDYEFKDNLDVTWGESGEGTISCDPTISKKTGIYDVTCTAIGNNDLSTTVSFTVKHSYPATYHYCSRTEKVCDSCKEVQDCESWCIGVCSDVPCTNCCCKWAHGDCKWVTSCEGCRDVEVNCSYYTCPLGGSLSGSTCYY